MISNDGEYMLAWKSYQAGRRSNMPTEELLRLQYELETWDSDNPRWGPWIYTSSGRRFWLTDPRPEDVDIEDIASSLSKQSRFGGHLPGDDVYSVSQHCWLCSFFVEKGFELEALLHDAAEAYCLDVPTPLKKLLGATYERIEDRILEAILSRFGVKMTPESVAAVKEVDQRMAATESRDLSYWGYLTEDITVRPFDYPIETLTPAVARQRFLDRFGQLMACKR